MISIVTPAHRVIPWLNARLINICSQDFEDWEWIILDNSRDGCVKRYVNDFFTNQQGLYFPRCKDKVKVFHEAFEGVSVADGRIGKVKNRAVELTSCKDDDFILLLDYDDFLFQGFLRNVYKVSREFPDCEMISGFLQTGLCQSIEDGRFGYHDTARDWLVPNCDDLVEALSRKAEYVWDVRGLTEYAGTYNDEEKRGYLLIQKENFISIPYNGFLFDFKEIVALNPRGYSLFSTVMHPHVFKKGAFLKKVGGWNTRSPQEDLIDICAVARLSNPVYIEEPCYCQCATVDSYGYRDSATNDITRVRNDKDVEIKADYLLERYRFVGDCNNFVKPKFWRN